MWEDGFRDQLQAETDKISIGPCTEFQHFTGPVVGEPAYKRITDVISKARDQGETILAGGSGESSKGWYIRPTVIITKDPRSTTMTTEIFGPVLTVSPGCRRC